MARARYLVRDMANGNVGAWNQAEWKIRQGNTHPDNIKMLQQAIDTLPDPRNPRPLPPDGTGRRFAIEVHASEDWGDEPVVHATEYVFMSEAEAEAEAICEMWRQHCLGTPRQWIGAYVTSNDSGDDGSDPSVENLVTLPS